MKIVFSKVLLGSILVSGWLVGCVAAQDRRSVLEPTIPAVSILLTGAASLDDDAAPDTRRLQDALDKCPKGMAVELKTGAFLAGPLQLRAGVTLLVRKGAVLYGSRDPRDYDLRPGSCGIVDKSGRGCKPLIGGTDVAGAAVMGDGVIDGRGSAKLKGLQVSWWDLAQTAKVEKANQNCPRILVLNRCNDFTLYRITLKNSPNFHVSYQNGNGFTAWGVIIDTPKTARNTDGIDPAGSTNVTITHCFIHTGDDNVAIKAGSQGGATYMTVAHNHFYTGHGMSIGSETDGGASAIRVTDLSIDGADNGIRIKSNSSRGGLVRDVIYEDVCIRNTRNAIYMDSNYSFYGEARDKLPQFREIVLKNVRIAETDKITLDGFDATHRLGIRFDNVTIGSMGKLKIHAVQADIEFGPGPVNFLPEGESVKITGSGGPGQVNTCKDKFVPMPVN